MKAKSLALSLITAIVFVGCATSGNEKLKDQTQSSIQQQITEGKTTMSDVQSKLGTATTVSFTDAGNEIWTYKYERVRKLMLLFQS